MADTATRRKRAARLRSETDNAISEGVPFLIETGWLDLVKYGQIRVVVVNHKVSKIYIEPSFETNIQTPDLALT